MNLLLAEDEIEISNMVKKFLELEGYEVDTAYNGEDALIVRMRFCVVA